MTMTAQKNFIITGTAQTPKVITGTAHCGILGQSGCHPRMEKYFLIGQFTSINLSTLPFLRDVLFTFQGL
jgi:hypothetical protein